MIILHIITGLNNAGAEAVLYRLVTGDTENKHLVISMTDYSYYGECLIRAGIPVYALNMPRGRLTFKGLIKLFNLIRTINPDVVQTWMYHADLVGGVIARLAGKRSVVWGVHHSNLDSATNRFTTRVVARLCALISNQVPCRIICCSATSACKHEAIGYNSHKLNVISNGINVKEFGPDPAVRLQLRNDWEVNQNEILIGMVARWDFLKDHSNLIEALSILNASGFKAWRCMLVGTEINEENKDLLSLLDKHGVRHHFILLGPRDDIPSVMKTFDLHVLSSSGEAFGNVTVEAMATGVPAVVTSVGAGAYIVGETGWVVSPSNPRALCDAIISAIKEMSNQEDWKNRKEACQLRVAENFSLEHMIKAYRTVWYEVSQNSLFD